MRIGFLLICIIYKSIEIIPNYDKLIFEENFDKSTLNLSKWEFDLGNGKNGWGNNEYQYYRKNDDNIYIDNNQLHIKAKIENYGEKSYTSAKITTKHTFQFTYGYIEARIKLPIGKGIWPAFWMLGANIDNNEWPKCGEIDIVEAVNTEQKIYNTLHWFNEETKIYNTYGTNKDVEKREEFDIYGVKWTENEVLMYIDDIETYRIDLTQMKTEAFNKPFYLLLNLAVGGNWPGFDIDNTVFPLEMVIDYIKIYQEEENFKYLQKHLIFNDEFNEDNLDRTKWDYSIGTGTNGWGTFQKQFYTDRKDNVFQSNSNLYIRAKEESYKGSSYTSGKIHTKYHMNFTYGIIETKIRFPSVSGISPGLWLSGIFNNNIWPKCGEIDALVGKDKNNEIHSGCTWDDNAAYYETTKLDITKFNEYTIIWDKKYITIYVDDLEIYKIDISPDNLIAFHYPFYINLNVLVGGNTVDYDVDKSSLPAEMIVDYIKVYQYELNNTINNNIIDDTSNNYIKIKLNAFTMLLLILILYW